MSRLLRTAVRIGAYAMIGYYGVEAVRIAQMLLELEHDDDAPAELTIAFDSDQPPGLRFENCRGMKVEGVGSPAPQWHPFVGRADRGCETCGLADRALIHHVDLAGD